MQTLDVAIGLVFVFLMLSLVCTAAAELLSQWFNSRATTLKQGIDTLLRNVVLPVKLERADPATRTDAGALTSEQQQKASAPNEYAIWIAAKRQFEEAESEVKRVASDALAAWTSASDAMTEASHKADQLRVQLRAALANPAGAAADTGGVDAATLQSKLDAALATLAGATTRLTDKRDALEAAAPRRIDQLDALRAKAASAEADLKLATFYLHPLIAGLSQLPWSLLPGAKKLKIPSYIPTKTFVLALIDQIAPNSSGSETPLLEVRRAIDVLPEHLRRPLLLSLNEAAGDVEKFRASLAAWYDTTMERVSGLYKRKSKVTVTLIAVVVTLFTNANTLTIVRALSSNPSLREAFVAAAQSTVKNPGSVQQQMTDTTPVPDSILIGRISGSIAQLQTLQLPMGYVVPDSLRAQLAKSYFWSAHVDTTPVKRPTPTGARATQAASDSLLISAIPSELHLYWTLFYHVYLPQALGGLIGLVITMLALSLGAPFWFDILNKIVNVRAVGRTPEENAKRASAS